MQSHYSPEALNTEPAPAQSKDYTIEGIEVQDQVIEEDTAVVVTDIHWNIGGSPVTTPREYFWCMRTNSGNWTALSSIHDSKLSFLDEWTYPLFIEFVL